MLGRKNFRDNTALDRDQQNAKAHEMTIGVLDFYLDRLFTLYRIQKDQEAVKAEKFLLKIFRSATGYSSFDDAAQARDNRKISRSRIDAHKSTFAETVSLPTSEQELTDRIRSMS